jgi:hypothetical protein
MINPTTGAGIWLGVVSGSLAILCVISPDLMIQILGLISSVLFFSTTLEKIIPPKKKVIQEPEPSPDPKPTRVRDLY